VAEPSAAPWCLLSLLIRGGRAPNIHVSLIAGGGHGPTPASWRPGGQPLSERWRVLLPADRSGAALEAAGLKCTAPESAGLKRADLEQGLLDRLVKKARVRSKM
jgi:hypothetical protein